VPTFRRTVEQEIFIWNGEPLEALPALLRSRSRKTREGLLVQAAEGPELCELGGWIATNSRGEFFTVPREQRHLYSAVTPATARAGSARG
jgi:hypothetical protein